MDIMNKRLHIIMISLYVVRLCDAESCSCLCKGWIGVEEENGGWTQEDRREGMRKRSEQDCSVM